MESGLNLWKVSLRRAFKKVGTIIWNLRPNPTNIESTKRIFKNFFCQLHACKQVYSATLNVPVVDKQSLIRAFRDAIKLGEATSSRTWYLNKRQCDLLREVLAWSMAEVQKVHVINETLCLDLCRLLGRVTYLLDTCSKARWENLPKLITLSHTCEAFAPLILLLVRSTVLIQAAGSHWSEDMIEKRVQEKYAVDWQPKLFEVAHEDQMRWFAESKEHSREESMRDAPEYVRRRLLHERNVVEGLRAGLEDSPIMRMSKDDIIWDADSMVGEGAFGKVFKVKWLGEWCAYKEFDGAENESFAREAAVLSTLRHPHIVHLVGCLIEQDRCALVMELLDCDLNLFLRLKEMANLDVVEALEIMLQIAQGLKYLHDKGIVHRDLKSANILVKFLRDRKHPMIGGYVVKVTDFGLAKTKFNSMETLRTHNVGTFQWTAPELFKTLSDEGVRNVEPNKYVFPKKADVYSFGIMCSEILTGRVPFSESQHSHRKKLKEEILQGRRPILPDTCPQFLSSFLQDCWHQSPDRRPGFDDVCTALERFKVRALTAMSHSTPPQERRNDSPADAQNPFRADSSTNPHAPPIKKSQSEIPISILLFSMDELKYATKDFSESCKIGQGGFGAVYKGNLRDGTTVAVKRAKKDEFLRRMSEEFHAELNMLSQAEHLNLVKLIGYFQDQESEFILVTEHVPNGNLRQHLDGIEGLASHAVLDITRRLNIAIDISNALSYLHYYTDAPIIHRDVKSSNVLLTNTFRAKLTDFGFSRAGPIWDIETHISTQIKGTAGYLDPEYLNTFQLSLQSDVYSFGILLVELFTGRRPIDLKRPSDERVTLKWAFRLFEEGRLKEIIDPKIEATPRDLKILDRVLELAFSCAAPTKVYRPTSKDASQILWNIRKDYVV